MSKQMDSDQVLAALTDDSSPRFWINTEEPWPWPRATLGSPLREGDILLVYIQFPGGLQIESYRWAWDADHGCHDWFSRKGE